MFLILIAVVLFAALAYSVTNTSRSGSADVSDEKADLIAAQIIQFATDIENAIVRLRLANGCAETEISFENPIVSGYTNATSPADYSCHVFHPNGGNIAWMPLPEDARDISQNAYSTYGQPLITGASCAYPYGTGLYQDDNCWSAGAGSSVKELMVFFPLITRAVCEAINRKVGQWTTIPQEYNSAYFWNYTFTGTFSSLGTVLDYASGAHRRNTPPTGCLQGNDIGQKQPVGSYHAFHVLIPR